MKTATAEFAKERDILFAKFPPGQVPEAADQLTKLDDVSAQAYNTERSVHVGYDLHQHTLQELEEHLENQGFHLDNTLMSKLLRALTHYSEETQLHNLHARTRPLKSSHQAYAQVWEQHLHGDHDDTPPEWREYK